jgi:hypothetical protein
MSSVIDATLCLVDSGLFTELAVRLAREITHVRSHVPWAAEFPTINDRWVGRGLGEVEWVEDPYRNEVFDTTDVYCFPDIFRAGEQQLLKRLGKPVWGSNVGDELETERLWFRQLQEELGMPVPEYDVIEGFAALEEYLQDAGHCWVKTTSKIRGSMETHEFWGSDQDYYWLEDLKVKLGGAREHVTFIVEQPIESKWESGIDTYCIRGQVPKTPMQGIEVKGKLILSSAQLRGNTPARMDRDLSLLAPELTKSGYCNFLSAEYRGDILSDFCARAPNPGIGVQMEMIRNLGAIVYHGAHGDMVEPDFEFQYGIQAAIFYDHEGAMWKQFPLADDIRRWVKLMEFAYIGGLYQIIPRPPHGQKIGWLLGVGNTIEEAAAHLHRNADALKGYPFDIKLDALPDAIGQALEMEKEGLEFSDQPIPAPETVVEEKS